MRVRHESGLDIFQTHVKGIPCQCMILDAIPYVPMKVYVDGDADPPEGGEVDFKLLDRKGYPAPWLHEKLDPDDIARLEEEAWICIEGQLREAYHNS